MKRTSTKRPHLGEADFKSPEIARWASFNQRCEEMVARCRGVAERERRLAKNRGTSPEDRERCLASADEWEKRAEKFEASVLPDAYLQRLDKQWG